ncbi:MAG TPA: NAD(P)/FAD-dependent oxidoreductase [Solirubrobacteraceae bacterium]|jgi:cation diffusion facilitator CzcD-associated flavoprotein CzcO
MSARSIEHPPETEPAAEHVDVLIVGAGVSGIGCAYHLQDKQPGKSYLILEAREAIGGTWDLFRYPGIRSDSDVHTFGYAFKPWLGEKAIADGPDILRYIRETAGENRIEPHIRVGHNVRRASWSSETARWTVEATRADGASTVRFTCGWLFCASGYYRHDEGYTPSFAGVERFRGKIVHPQHWPEDLDYAGKRVVVIGSGATAVTLVPALAEEAAHVTMLQRSPSYIVSVPARDAIADALKRVLPARTAYSITRRKNIWLQKSIYQLSRSRPQLLRRRLRAGIKRRLPAGYAIDTHFNPRYDPWDQRLCAVPDGDLFEAIRCGRASVATDRIERFSEHAIELASGAQLEADIVVTATGLNLLALGGIELTVDGERVAPAQTIAYRAMMLSDVPNFAYAFGYTNASWTLKVDLVCEYLCRLLGYMQEHGYDTCVAHNDDPTLTTLPLLDFAAGYVQRSVHLFPRQGSRHPWSVAMSYAEDVRNLRGSIEDPALRFSRAALLPETAPTPALAG